jgi:HAD superfamily phosphatase (TIGR01668 family)
MLSIVRKYLMPDIYVNSIYNITPDILISKGIKGVICDIDNTLVPYEVLEPTADIINWLTRMTQNGIAISLVSNNNAERVNMFNSRLNFYASANSIKPSRRYLREAMAHMNTNIGNTAIIGDQLFTDIFAGKRLHMFAILVNPIRDKKNLFVKIKRLFENPIKKMYKKEHNL